MYQNYTSFDTNDVTRIIVLNELTIDTVAKRVTVANVGMELTRTEYDLLLYLAINKNKIISKDAIAEHISGAEADVFDNFDFLYAHIKNLKKKMIQGGCDDYIKSIYGMGYKFDI